MSGRYKTFDNKKKLWVKVLIGVLSLGLLLPSFLTVLQGLGS